MAKHAKNSRENLAKRNREEGWELVAQSDIFYELAKAIYVRPDVLKGDNWARVELGVGRPTFYFGTGNIIYYHPERLASPQEWAWVFAHCLLHIGLNHSDPVTSGGLERDHAHNAVSCVAVNRLLSAIKIGEAPFPQPEYPSQDERTLGQMWRRDGVPPEFENLGTANPDIIGAILPCDSQDAKLQATRFAAGLARAVTKAVEQAGGYTSDHKEKQAWDFALGWFSSSYPLLGGLAAGFTIVADAEVCRAYDIAIAAVDPTVAQIYINPTAGLKEPQWRFVLAHEMLHAGLRHGERAMGRDPYIWNVACDYVVNGWLMEMGVGDMPDGLLYDMELKGMSADAVYDRIANDARRIRKLATLRGVCLGDVLGEPLPIPREEFGAIDLDEFYRRALTTGLAYHDTSGRGLLPKGLVEEIRVIDSPPITWDVALAHWFEAHVRSPEAVRSYSRVSRRQASTPDIPRPGRYFPESQELACTFGVVLDTSGSMSGELLGKALGAIASYSKAKDVPAARVVYCDAAPHDAGYVPVDDIVDRVKVTGRGGTVLQPAIRFLERTPDFPSDGPILIITDGMCDVLTVHRDHAYLIPANASLPFPPGGPVFRVR